MDVMTGVSLVFTFKEKPFLELAQQDSWTRGSITGSPLPLLPRCQVSWCSFIGQCVLLVMETEAFVNEMVDHWEDISDHAYCLLKEVNLQSPRSFGKMPHRRTTDTELMDRILH